LNRHIVTLMGIAILMGVISVSLVSAATFSYTIDFEGLDEGAIVSELDCGSGISCPDADLGGSIAVRGVNPDLDGEPNAAMIFDAECDGGCTGGDPDLEYPGHGNTLIISEDLDQDDPDDGDVVSSFLEFDFNDFPGIVTIESIDVGDIEEREAGAFVHFHEGECTGHPLDDDADNVDLPITGDHEIVTKDINVSSHASGAECLHVHLNGSGTVDNIEFRTDFQPAIDIRKQAEGPDSRSFPAGSDVTFEIGVQNTGDVDLSNVVVTDVLVPACDRDIGDLPAGATETYTCTAPASVFDADPTNVACVTGQHNGVMPDQDCDPSTVEFVDPVIDIEKWTKIVVPTSGGDVCETLGKPKKFTLRYTGDNVLKHSQKEGKVKVKGKLDGESPVHIKSDKFSKKNVKIGDDFDIEKGKVTINDGNGRKLKEIEFHTSCSQPLVLGDQYGGVQLVGYTGKNGKSGTFDPTPDDDPGVDADEPAGPQGQVGDPVTWTYFVTNPGDSPLSDIVVTDDQGTPNLLSDDYSPDFVDGDENGDGMLQTTETWRYQAMGTVESGQYKNIGHVSGVDPNGTEVTDEDSSHHIGVFPAGDICEGKGKPKTLKMLYTGKNILDHSQKKGKVNVSGDPKGAAVVHIIAAEKANGSGKKYFDGTVNLGEQFVIGGTENLKSQTFVLVKSQDNKLLQTIEFHTSCSQPLNHGNQFGGVQLIGFTK